MTEVPVGRKDLLNVVTYYFTVLQILFINIIIALMRKKIKFLETVKLTERTMLLQNYLCSTVPGFGATVHQGTLTSRGQASFTSGHLAV